MYKTFEHNQYEIEFRIIADNEDDAYADEFSVWDKELQKEVKFEELPDKDQSFIGQKADDLAYENAYEAYMDRMIMAADAYYDEMKEKGE